MITKAILSKITIIVLLIVGMCFPMIGNTKDKTKENSITKNITLPHHIDGGKTILLDLTKHIGLTDDETSKLTKTLSTSQIDKSNISTKGITIELLKPIDSIVHPKALVIREIKVDPALKRVEMTENAGVTVKYTFKTDGKFDGVEPPDELIKQLNEGDIIFNEMVQGNRDSVMIRLFNTTKSRINLKDWQIRLTFGSVPDGTDVTDRVIDRMSNVDEKVPVLEETDKTIPALNLPKSLIMFRKIDFKLLDNPAKTLDEQLNAIANGTQKSGWSIKTPSKQPQWVELRDPKNNLRNLKGSFLLVFPSKGDAKLPSQVIIEPRQKIDKNSPPTDDR